MKQPIARKMEILVLEAGWALLAFPIPLITFAATLKNAVDSLMADAYTNHGRSSTGSSCGSSKGIWKISELGVSANEGASLEFYIKYIAPAPGQKLANQSIPCSDSERNVVVFPDPSITVEGGMVVNPESCPVPVDLTIDGLSGFRGYRWERHLFGISGTNSSIGCHDQKCLPWKVGCFSRNSYRGRT